MVQAYVGNLGCVARLPQDTRVRATVDFQDKDGDTALHNACTFDEYKNKSPAMVHHLLQAGANPFLTNKHGLTPLSLLQQRWPSYRGAIALLEQAPDAQKASVLVKARRLFVISTSNAAPFYLQGRVVRRQPLPSVTLLPVMDGKKRARERRCKLRTFLVFVLGMGGGLEGEGMPRDVFRVMLDMLMPLEDPLRLGIVGEGGEI